MASGIREVSGLRGYDNARLEEGYTRVIATTVRPDGQNRYPGFSAALLDEGPNHYNVAAMDDHVIFMTQRTRENVATDFDGKYRRINIPRQALTLIPAGTPSHWSMAEPGGEILHIHLCPKSLADWLHEDEQKLELRPVVNEADADLRRCADGLMREMLNSEPAGRIMIEALALQFAVLVRRQYGTDLPVEFAKGGLAPWQLRQATEYLNDHIGDEVTITDLARTTGLSRFHFMRAFKQSTGKTLMQTLIDLRIAKARDLLEHTGLPVGAIAAMVGYEAPQAFARVFRRETGIAPAEYRRERCFKTMTRHAGELSH